MPVLQTVQIFILNRSLVLDSLRLDIIFVGIGLEVVLIVLDLVNCLEPLVDVRDNELVVVAVDLHVDSYE